MKDKQVVLLLANGMTLRGEVPSEEEEKAYNRTFIPGSAARFRALKNVRIEPTGQMLTWLIILKGQIIGEGPFQAPIAASKRVSTLGIDAKALEDTTNRSQK